MPNNKVIQKYIIPSKHNLSNTLLPNKKNNIKVAIKTIDNKNKVKPKNVAPIKKSIRNVTNQFKNSPLKMKTTENVNKTKTGLNKNLGKKVNNVPIINFKNNLGKKVINKHCTKNIAVRKKCTRSQPQICHKKIKCDTNGVSNNTSSCDYDSIIRYIDCLGDDSDPYFYQAKQNMIDILNGDCSPDLPVMNTACLPNLDQTFCFEDIDKNIDDIDKLIIYLKDKLVQYIADNNKHIHVVKILSNKYIDLHMKYTVISNKTLNIANKINNVCDIIPC
jgi:hypothetical protein